MADLIYTITITPKGDPGKIAKQVMEYLSKALPPVTVIKTPEDLRFEAWCKEFEGK